MLRSFRLKIGLLSVCLSGLLLLGFGRFAVSALSRLGIDRIDRELRALADAQVRKVQPEGHWRRFDDSLRAIYGADASKQFVVHVVHSRGETLYASAKWPADLPHDTLPLSLDRAPESNVEGPPIEGDVRPAEDPPPRPRPFDESPPRNPPPRRLPVRGSVYETLGGANGVWRAMTIGNAEVTLSLAMNLAGLHAETRRFERALLVGIPMALLLIIAGGWMIGQMALRPVNVIARTAESVTAHRLHARIPAMNADTEFQRLIVLINSMLERLERSFQQATRFSADAAHELKTPLAILQAQVERSLQRAEDGTPEQRECGEQLDEVQRLKAILGKLLLLSQADSGRLPLSREPINLAEMVRAAAEDVHMLAPDRKTTVIAPQNVMVMADAHLLNQVIENLVSNAIKFGDKDGAIELTLNADGNRAIFRVSNTGRPIAAEDQSRVLERFFRGDKARTRDIEGSGLGLSLAREIARAHGGDLVLERSDEHVTTFALTLPLGHGNG
jgi:heavy metal sensor kinase